MNSYNTTTDENNIVVTNVNNRWQREKHVYFHYWNLSSKS